MSDYTAALDAAIANLEAGLAALQAGGDPTALAAVRADLAAVQATVAQHGTRLDADDTDDTAALGALQASLATAQAAAASAQTVAGTAQTAATSAQTVAGTAQTAATAAQSSATANQTAMTALAVRVTALENKMPPPPPPPPPPNTDPAVSFTVDRDTGINPLSLVATVTAVNADHWQFDWQGGTTQGVVHPATDVTVNHIYDQPGTYVATVRAWRDSDGKQATAEHTFVAQPMASLGGTVGQIFGGYGTPVGAYKTKAYNVTEAAKVAAAGFGWMRCDLTVSQVAPTATTRNWQSAWNWIDPFAAQDVKLMANLYILPSWMNGSSDDKTQPTTDKIYADFCAEAAPLLYQHGVRAVELWNEQNWGFWKPTPDRARYVSMAKAAALAIKAAEPRMLVVSGGLSTADTEYNNATHKTVTRFDTGASYTSPELGANQSLDIYGALGLWALKTPTGAQAIDGAGIHPYLDGVDPGVDVTDPNWMAWQQTPMRRSISILDRWGGQGVKVWNTESACPRTKADGTVNVTEAVQATRAANAFKAFNTWTLADGTKMSNRLGPYFYFTFADWADSTESPRARSFGLTYPDYSPHPAATAVTAVLASKLV